MREQAAGVRWYLGTMGYGFKDWVGVFYPPDLKPRDFLAWYSRHFNAVEMDSTFYAPPAAAHVRRWFAITPDDFTFCPKMPRDILLAARTEDPRAAVHAFVERVALLEHKLGPILLQFPPDFDRARFLPAFERLLHALPPTQRYAVEFRHRSWFVRETIHLLRAHGVTWVAADYEGVPKQVLATTDFLYLRWIDRHGRYAQKNREQRDVTPRLRWWLERIEARLPYVSAVYGFFNNQYAGHSPATCNRFKELVGLPVHSARLL